MLKCQLIGQETKDERLPSTLWDVRQPTSNGDVCILNLQYNVGKTNKIIKHKISYSPCKWYKFVELSCDAFMGFFANCTTEETTINSGSNTDLCIAFITLISLTFHSKVR